ncbi:hypothetical protein TNCV_1718041 [Trichonephila clavipes]|nr:hypothetical protein TNCV_1718041 [Trichonephila clavipes]
MNGTKFASPTEFSYSARRGNRMELHSTRFSHFGGLWEANIKSMKRIFIEGSEIGYHELRRVNYVDGTNRSSSEFTSLCLHFLRTNDLNPLTPGAFLDELCNFILS